MVSRLLMGSGHKCRPHLSAALLACWLIPPCLPDGAHAQVPPPITSSGLNTTVAKSGNVYDITGGTRPGSGPNLFHSFGEFGVPTNHVANFLNDAALPTSNILGRVTGGNPSNIFGTLQTTGFGSANLFLMNPAGIVFGPTASLNVGGSVSFTTADYLRLADGATFTALPGPHDTAISSAPVAAFGFLGSNPAAITVEGSQLAVSEGHGISLVGGNITVQSGTLDNATVQPARLVAPGGHINLASVASPGEVLTAGALPTEPTLSGFTSMGTIALTPGAMVSTSGHTAGRIVIRSGQFSMEGATLEASTTALAPNLAASAPATGEISVEAEDVTLSHGSNVIASTSRGTAGNISFEVGTFRSNVAVDGTPLTGAAPVTIESTSTGQGGAGSISIGGKTAEPADAVLLSNTHVVTGVTNAADPTVAPGNIDVAAQRVELTNGSIVSAGTTGGADAGAITLNVATLSTQSGPDGRVFITSSSHCEGGCLGGQAGDITIQGLPGITPSSTRTYRHVTTPNSEPNRAITYHFARELDIQGTDIHSDAIGNAPGGKVIMRAQELASFADTNISVATQDFKIEGSKPNGQPARYQGFSNIDILAKDIVLQDSTIKADALVSDIGTCPLCLGGPSAGEIWLRTENSLIATNSSITNTSRGRAQAGITKIIGDHYFSEGALWDTLYPDKGTRLVQLTNSEVTVEAQHSGLPGYLRIRADHTILDHSIVNSKANDVSNVKTLAGELIDVVGAGERSVVVSDGRSVQGSLLLVAESLDIIGGGIIAPTQGNRVASRMDLQVDNLTTRPGTRPGGTLDSPQILNTSDPTRVVISSSSTGAGGAGTITISGRRQPAPGTAPLTPAKSIRLDATDVLTDTRSDALGGKIELNSGGPIELRNTTISSNVHDVRPPSATVRDPGGNIAVSAGSLIMLGGEISALSTGTQTGGNIVLTAQNTISMSDGATISASSTGNGNAGNIAINAGTQFFSHNASVTTQANQASGGNITLQATDSIRLVNSQLNTSVQGGPNTSGGNITIDPAVVTLQNSQVLAQASQGTGGNINIIAGTFLADQTSVVSASSQFGLSGAVNIQSPVSSLSNTLATLPQQLLQVQNLMRQRCAAQANGQLSSFVMEGRDALPVEPGGWLMSPLAWMADDEPASPAHVADNRAFEPSHSLGHAGQWSDQRDSSSQRGVYDRATGCGS